MATKVAINGFGRVGRTFLRQAFSAKGGDIEIVAMNDLTDEETVANTSSDITANTNTVTAIFNVGVASDKLQRGYVTLVPATLA